MYCYRIVSTKDPEKYPVGQIFLMKEDQGAIWEPNRYVEETMSFEDAYMKARRLGQVHARTTRGKVLAVNHLLRSAGYKSGFLRVPKAVRA